MIIGLNLRIYNIKTPQKKNQQFSNIPSVKVQGHEDNMNDSYQTNTSGSPRSESCGTYSLVTENTEQSRVVRLEGLPFVWSA